MAAVALALVVGVGVVSVEAAAGFMPQVAGVPYHRQIVDYSCGDATAEMILHAFGPDVDQRALIDVMRTSPDEGTLSWDMVRGMHFSSLSASPVAGMFPAQRPAAGWSAARKTGLAGFGFRPSTLGLPADECWVEQLAGFLEHGGGGAPVAVLQHFSRASPGGHFRVLTGVEWANETTVSFLTMQDPWDRQKINEPPGPPQPHVIRVSRAEFCWLWSHRESAVNGTNEPFFAMYASPWKVDVRIDARDPAGYTVSAGVTYPYPTTHVFPRHAPLIARDVQAELQLPGWAKAHQPLILPLGGLRVGETRRIQWEISTSREPYPTTGGSGPGVDDDGRWARTEQQVQQHTTFSVAVSGEVQASVPATFGLPNAKTDPPLPAYTYRDRIGGIGYAHLTPNFMYTA